MDVHDTVLNIKTEGDDAETIDAELNSSKTEAELKQEMTIKVEADTALSEEIKQEDHFKPDPDGDLSGCGQAAAPVRNIAPDGPSPDEFSFCKEEGELRLEMTCKVEVDTGVSEDILNGNTGDIPCDHCDYVCIGETLMAEHVRRRHGHLGRNGKYKCTQCKYSCNDFLMMQRHQRTHIGERPYRCDKCAKAFTTKGSLKQHVQSVHDGLRPHVCDVCGKAFTQAGSLNTHRRIHSNTSVVQCEQCGQQFSNRSHYITHMKAHDDVKPHSCSVCAAGFVRRTQLTRHMRVHTGDKPYQCTHCELRFSWQSGLRCHVIAKHTHDYKHRCANCNTGFLSPSSLRKHGDKCAEKVTPV